MLKIISLSQMVQCKSLSSNLVEGELEPWDVCRATKSLFPVLRIHHSRTCSPKLFYSLHYFLRHLHVIFHIYLVKYNSYPFVVLCFFFAIVLLPVTDQYWGQYCRMVQWDLGWGPLCGSSELFAAQIFLFQFPHPLSPASHSGARCATIPLLQCRHT